MRLERYSYLCIDDTDDDDSDDSGGIYSEIVADVW